MIPGLPAPLLFAAHLLAFLVALAAALVLAREHERGPFARTVGGLGFLALAAAEAYHGAGFAGDTGALVAWVRTGAYALLALAAVPSARPASRPAAVPAVVAIPGGLAVPAVAAGLAGLVTAFRRRGERGGIWLGIGLLLLGAADWLLEAGDRSWIPAASHAARVAGYLCVARMVVAVARRSIRFRFIVGFAALLLAVVLFVSAAIGTVIDENLREGALTRVTGQAAEAQRRMIRLVTAEVESLVFVGQAEEIAEPIRQGQPLSTELIQGLRDELFADVDFILFLDLGGAVRGRFGLGPVGAFDVVGTRVVQFALRSRQEASSLEDLSGGGLALIGVAPIVTPDRRGPVGFGVAGFLIDEDLLQREAVAGGESRAAAFRGFRGRAPVLVAETGFPDREPDAPLASATILQATLERFRSGGESEARALTLGGDEHFASLTPLRPEVGSPVGVLVVAEPATILAATERQLNEVLFLVTVGVIGLALLLALVAARRITRPLVVLTGAARRVQAGDLGTMAEVGGEDEVADLAGAFNQMTASVSSMTGELREAAAEQSRLRTRLETVVNSMGDGLIAVDERERVVTYNPAAGEIVGKPRSRVVGRPLEEVLLGRDADGRALGASTANGPAFVSRPDGGEVPVAITSSPLRDGNGVRLGNVYVLRDMTREYEVERMKREFLTNVSHELRTPLTPIIGFSEILTRREVTTQKAREFAGGILEAGRKLERIVAMLVDFSAIEAGRLTVSAEPTPLEPLVEKALERWRPRSERHRLAVRVRGALPPALVNPTLFTRVLDELLDNGIKYSPQGGAVTVSVTSEGRVLAVEVSDEGIGIEPEDLARVFQEFRQADASNTRAFGGLGLGLSFAKRVVEAQGGVLTAVSEPGRGATFTFTVPVAHTE